MELLIVKSDNGDDYESYYECIEYALLFSSLEEAKKTQAEFDKLPGRYSTEIHPVVLDAGVGIVAKKAWRARAFSTGNVVRHHPLEGFMEIAAGNEHWRLEKKTLKSATVISFESMEHAVERARAEVEKK